MKCECGTDTKTKDTRKIEQGIWRRRFCPSCGAEFTTLEQRCETLKNPYPNKKGAPLAQGVVVAPAATSVKRPQRENQRATGLRKAPAPAAPKAKPLPQSAPPRVKSEPARVDRLAPTARDRIEDLKFDREQADYGWE